VHWKKFTEKVQNAQKNIYLGEFVKTILKTVKQHYYFEHVFLANSI